MPTAIGIAFFCLAAFCFCKGGRHLFGLLIFSAIFQASSAFGSSTRGIQPYYIVALFVIARTFIDWAFGNRRLRRFKGESAVVIFALFGAASAFLYPILFRGIPVYEPSIGIDDGLFFRPPLRFGIANVAQAVFIIVQALVIVSARRMSVFSTTSRKWYVASFYVLVVVIVAQFASAQLGLNVPFTLLRNNPGYSMASISAVDRTPGTFTEPSAAGLALSLFFIGFFFELMTAKASLFRVLVGAAAICVVSSTASLASIAIGFSAFLLMYRPMRMAHLKFALPLLFVAGIILMSPVRDSLLLHTIQKGDSSSFLNRTAADLYALELAQRTHFLGVGLGSNRPSSFVTSLISNVGLVGTMLFAFIFVRLILNVSNSARWVKWSVSVMMINMLFAVPDITFPFMWIGLALTLHFGDASDQASNTVRKTALCEARWIPVLPSSSEHSL